ncbi:MAG: hypothetical protein AAF468_08190 [Pseudomonadota bacterium]
MMIPSRTLTKTGLLIAAVTLSACTSTSGVSTTSAKTYSVMVCSGYGCEYTSRLSLAARDMGHIRNTLKRSKNAQQERAAIAKLVSWKEKLAERKLRFPKDVKLSYQPYRGIRGHMDCIDESNNTLAFLQFLAREKLLKFHSVKGTATRGFLLDFRHPHTTAVIKENSGVEWSVDSWTKNSGAAPDVEPLSVWRKKRTEDG